MRFVICDDNIDDLEHSASIIRKWADSRSIIANILCFNNAEEFLFSWPDMIVDIIFLDIMMKKMSGIKLAEKIRKIDNNVIIIFVTNFLQYSLKGYDVNAFHYLVKPLSSDKLNPVLDKAYGIWCSHEKDSLIIKTDSGQLKISCGNICYIKVQLHTAELHTETETYEIRRTIKELIDLLPSYFIRCYRSYIVNILKIDCVFDNSLILSTGDKLPISRNNAKRVKDAFMRLNKE